VSRRTDDTRPEPDPPRAIEDLARENERLRRKIEALERGKASADRERERLRRKIERLQQHLDAARRAGFRQAAPFSRGAPKPDPKRPGRKRGPGYGKRARRRKPRTINVIYEAPLPQSCPECGGSVKEERVAPQYQEDIPPVTTTVSQFNVHIGYCSRCNKRVQGRHPLQTSDALGAAASQVGPQAVAFAALLNKKLGLSYGKIVTLLRERFELRITRGGLVTALHRAAARAGPTYEALCASVRGSPMVVPDETGWKVAATLWWLHTIVTPDTTVYKIAPGRGFDVAASIIGEDYAGTIVRDGWAPYRRFTSADHQTCLAHLLRRARELMEDHPQVRMPGEIKSVLQRALALRDRVERGEISEHGLASARGRLNEELVLLLERGSSEPAVNRFANHLITEFTAMFTFLTDPTIDATNWRAEQAVRPLAITRKVCGGGNRTERGAVTQQVLGSLLRTGDQRNLNSAALIVRMLRSHRPIVPLQLQ
jgi:transposase